jgi:hypothetical protein
MEAGSVESSHVVGKARGKIAKADSPGDLDRSV